MENAPFFVDTEVITLSRNGVWISDGTEITHEPTRRLFARSLKKDADGYFIQVGRETKRIQVEDTPYFIQRLEGFPETGYEVVLTDESHQPLNPLTLHYRPGRLTCRLENREEAKFLHSPYSEILKDLQEDETTYFITVNGHRVDLALKADIDGLLPL